jgi:CDP-ribitol ribitolphosphotransferase / teichoic acid ribitol-phosphate polymerase
MSVVLKITVWMLQAASLPFRPLHIQNKITLISRQSDEVPADFLLIGANLNRQRPEIKVQYLTKKLVTRKPRVLLYPFHMLRQLYHISTSRVVILDGYCIVACVLPHKPETILIQMWHATSAIKKFGWQIVGKPCGAKEATAIIMHMHDKYDLVLAPSQKTGSFYQEAFHVGPDKIKYFGLPNLSILQERQPQRMKEIRDMFSIDRSKKTVLYVPTFRAGKCVNLQDLVDEIDLTKYQLIAKIHPLDKLTPRDARVIYPTRFSTIDWMKFADIIITDYSSLLVETAIMNKPLYLYVYDLDDYRCNPGLNIDFEEKELQPIVYHDASSLVKTLDAPYDFNTLTHLRNQFLDIDIKNAQKALGDYIIELFDEKADLPQHI